MTFKGENNWILNPHVDIIRFKFQIRTHHACKPGVVKLYKLWKKCCQYRLNCISYYSLFIMQYCNTNVYTFNQSSPFSSLIKLERLNFEIEVWYIDTLSLIWRNTRSLSACLAGHLIWLYFWNWIVTFLPNYLHRSWDYLRIRYHWG